MKNCETCDRNNNAEWDERNCPFKKVDNCIEDNFDNWLENNPNAVIQGHSFDSEEL